MKIFLVVAFLALGASAGRALDVVFTITGVALEGEPGETLGYDEGEIITIQLIMPGGLLGSAGGGGIDWLQFELTDPAVWSSVTGTGLTGTYVVPAEPLSYVLANESGFFGFEASSSDLESDIGLLAPDGTPVLCLCADLNTGVFFAEPPADQTAEEYFAAYVGVVPVDPGMILMMEGVASAGGFAEFEVTGLSIALVPEPSAALLLGAGLGVLLMRRCRGSGRVSRS